MNNNKSAYYNRFFITGTDYDWQEVTEEVIGNPDPNLFIENKAFVLDTEHSGVMIDVEAYGMSLSGIKNLLDKIACKSNKVLGYEEANLANLFNPSWFDLHWNKEHTKFIPVLKETVSYVTEF